MGFASIDFGRRTIVSLSIVPLVCLGLTACGGSSGTSSSSAANAAATGAKTAPSASASSATTPGNTTPSSTATSSRAADRASEIALIRRLVGCMRSKGIDLPEPDASGHVDTKGFNQNGARWRAAVNGCLREAKHH